MAAIERTSPQTEGGVKYTSVVVERAAEIAKRAGPTSGTVVDPIEGFKSFFNPLGSVDEKVRFVYSILYRSIVVPIGKSDRVLSEEEKKVLKSKLKKYFSRKTVNKLIYIINTSRGITLLNDKLNLLSASSNREHTRKTIINLYTNKQLEVYLDTELQVNLLEELLKTNDEQYEKLLATVLKTTLRRRGNFVMLVSPEGFEKLKNFNRGRGRFSISAMINSKPVTINLIFF